MCDGARSSGPCQAPADDDFGGKRPCDHGSCICAGAVADKAATVSWVVSQPLVWQCVAAHEPVPQSPAARPDQLCPGQFCLGLAGDGLTRRLLLGSLLC